MLFPYEKLCEKFVVNGILSTFAQIDVDVFCICMIWNEQKRTKGHNIRG